MNMTWWEIWREDVWTLGMLVFGLFCGYLIGVAVASPRGIP